MNKPVIMAYVLLKGGGHGAYTLLLLLTLSICMFAYLYWNLYDEYLFQVIQFRKETFRNQGLMDRTRKHMMIIYICFILM